jgi:hypothetical protein
MSETGAQLTTLETWWMDWAFRHTPPKTKYRYTLGQAVRASFLAGRIAEHDRHCGGCKLGYDCKRRQELREEMEQT